MAGNMDRATFARHVIDGIKSYEDTDHVQQLTRLAVLALSQPPEVLAPFATITTAFVAKMQDMAAADVMFHTRELVAMVWNEARLADPEDKLFQLISIGYMAAKAFSIVHVEGPGLDQANFERSVVEARRLMFNIINETHATSLHIEDEVRFVGSGDDDVAWGLMIKPHDASTFTMPRGPMRRISLRELSNMLNKYKTLMDTMLLQKRGLLLNYDPIALSIRKDKQDMKNEEWDEWDATERYIKHRNQRRELRQQLFDKTQLMRKTLTKMVAESQVSREAMQTIMAAIDDDVGLDSDDDGDEMLAEHGDDYEPEGMWDIMGEVKVKHLTGRTVSTRINLKLPLEQLMRNIEQQLGIPVDQQVIVIGDGPHGHTRLEDTQVSMLDHGIDSTTTVHVIPQMRGGGKAAPTRRTTAKTTVKTNVKDIKKHKKVAKQADTTSESNEEDDEEDMGGDDDNDKPTPRGDMKDTIADCIKTYEDNFTLAKASPAFNDTVGKMFAKVGVLMASLNTEPEDAFGGLLKDKTSTQLEQLQSALEDIKKCNGNPQGIGPLLFKCIYATEAEVVGKMVELARLTRETFNKVLYTSFINAYGNARAKGIVGCNKVLKRLIREKMKQEAAAASRWF